MHGKAANTVASHIGAETPARRRPELHSSVPALLVLIVSLAATVVSWYIVRTQAEANAEADFESNARQIALTVDTRMQTYEDSLHAAAALFAASSIVTRDDWSRFVDRLELRREHPGIEQLGFARHLRSDALERHEHEMQDQGEAGYRVWPSGVRNDYVAVTFIEPFSAETHRMLGYDFLSSTASQEAMQKASDSGFPTLSSRWIESADAASARRPTLLMFEALYPGESADGAAAHDKAPIGYALRSADGRRVAGLDHRFRSGGP